MSATQDACLDRPLKRPCLLVDAETTEKDGSTRGVDSDSTRPAKEADQGTDATHLDIDLEVAFLCEEEIGLYQDATPTVRPASGVDRDDPKLETLRKILKKEKLECFRSNPRYLEEVQKHGMNDYVRAFVMDWCIELVEEMRMSNETLLLAYNFLDRYLSCMSVANNNLKLTTITCLWVASKLCDGPVPTAKHLCKHIGGSAQKKSIVEMERWLLKGLRWNLNPPTVYHFVHAMLPFVSDETGKLTEFSEHVAVAQALCYSMSGFLPSTIAIAAISCAAELATHQKSDHIVEHLCTIAGAGVDIEHVMTCLRKLETHIQNNLIMTGSMQACTNKAREAESPTGVKVGVQQMHDAQLEEHLSGSRYVFLPSAPRASVDTHATHASKFVPIAKPTPLCDRRPASALAM